MKVMLKGCQRASDADNESARIGMRMPEDTSYFGEKPAISVVIPTHGRDELLCRSIASVQAQTLKNIEILVVCDSNQQHPSSVAASAARQDARVRVYMNERGRGASGARNTGLMYARGWAVAFLDDDDAFRRDKLEIQLPLVSSASVVGCAHRLRGRGEEGVEDTNVSERRLARDGLSHQVATRTLTEFWWSNAGLSPSAIIAKRSLLLEVGGFDEELSGAQGIDLVGRMIALFGAARVVEAPLVVRDTKHGQGTITGTSAAVAGYWKEFQKNRHLRDEAAAQFRETQILLREASVARNPLARLRLIIRALRRYDVRHSRAYARLFVAPLGARARDRLYSLRRSLCREKISPVLKHRGQS